MRKVGIRRVLMSELYQLPDGWEWKKLGEVTSLVGGGTPSRNIIDYWENGNIVWLSPTDLGNIGEINSIANSKDKITQLGLEKSSARLLPIGAVLFSSRATIGKIAINTIELSTNQGFTNFICNDSLNNQYLAYCLVSFTKEITALSNSTTFKEVSKSALKEFNIPVAQLAEQKRIVQKLDALFERIDKAIALLQKNIDAADNFMNSVLNDVFSDLEQNSPLLELDKTVDFGGKNIVAINNPDLIYLSLEDIQANTGKIINYRTVSESGVIGTSVLFDNNCVLYSKLRPYLNKVTVPEVNGCATTELVVIKPHNNLCKHFLSYFLRNPMTVNFLNNDSMGAKMPRTNMKTFKRLNVPVPEYSKQLEVVKYLNNISAKIEQVKSAQQQKMQNLLDLKSSILDQAFHGKL